MQAEQGLAAAALHVADLRKQVHQKQAELQAAERERQVGAALAGQLPRLQRWQNMQVTVCTHPTENNSLWECKKNVKEKEEEKARQQNARQRHY